MKPILIIDDDTEFCSMLHDYLIPYDLHLNMRHDGESGLTALRSEQYDMVLLDLMLPDTNGMEVLSSIKSFTQLSVLLISALGGDSARIAGLDKGADDYLPKPFNPRELVSRIRAILRRSLHTDISIPRSSHGVVLDHDAREAYYRGKRLPLTDTEFTLLSIFCESPGIVLAREDLVGRVFDRPFHPLDRSLDMHISRLRKKLFVVKEFSDPIKTIRSSGYLFVPKDMNSAN